MKKPGIRAGRAIRRAAMLIALAFLGGCGLGKKQEERTNLEFTVVDEERLPEELARLVGEKKSGAFKLTYADGGYLYLCIGYGKQETGGYSISVNDLYETANAIYLDTSLIGPKEADGKNGSPSYPYLVIKTPFMDKTVVFD